MKKNLLNWIVTLSILLICVCILPTRAQAASISDLTFELDWNGESYYVSDCNTSASGELVIPSTYNGKPVTIIGYEAFRDCTRLTSVIIPNSVTSIDSYAFYDCVRLTSIVIPESVTKIYDHAFLNCANLTSITIPNSVTYIGDNAFSNCTKLTTVNFNATNCTTMGGSYGNSNYCVFTGCSSLTTINIGNNVTTIPNYAFRGCYSLTSVTIPDSVTYISGYAFYNCTSLTQVHITDLAAWCRINFSSSYSNPFSNNVNFYPADAKLYLNGELVTDLVIPDGVTSIGEQAFSGCTNLTSITIPDSVTSIGNSAFSYCSSLTSITIPNSVTSIGNSAFYNCTSLTRITIPNSVTSIGSCAFDSCTSLTSITIPDGVTNIEESTFFGCNKLTQIVLPQGMDQIKEGAFYWCDNLETVYHRGTQADWDWILIGDNNSALTNATIIHNFTGNFVAIKTQPKSVTVADGAQAAVKVTATGDGLTYKWYYKYKNNDAFALSSCTKNTYSVQMNGNRNIRWVYCVITDKYGNSVQTDTVTLETKLAAPSNFKAVSNGYNSIKISWNAVTDAQYYELYRSDKPTTGFQKIGTYTSDILQKVQTGLTIDKTYYYRIRAYRVVNGYKKYSQYTVVKSATPTLAAPTISVAKNSYNSLKITWNKVNGATAYELYRSTNPNTGFKKLGTYTAETFSKISSSLATGTRYYYKVCAYRVVDGYKKYSDYSAVKSGTPTLSAPTGVKATTGTTKGTVNVSWSKTDGATYYQVYRREVGSTKWSLLGTYDSDTLSMTSKKLASGKTYEYRVRCYRWSGGVRQFSGWSTIVSAKAK